MATEQPSKSRCPPPDGLTRSQVARQLGVGVTAVHHMRLRGDLRPKRDAAGVWRYDPADVIRAAANRAALPPNANPPGVCASAPADVIRAAANRGVRGLKTAGDIAAEAFRMFD